MLVVGIIIVLTEDVVLDGQWYSNGASGVLVASMCCSYRGVHYRVRTLLYHLHGRPPHKPADLSLYLAFSSHKWSVCLYISWHLALRAGVSSFVLLAPFSQQGSPRYVTGPLSFYVCWMKYLLAYCSSWGRNLRSLYCSVFIHQLTTVPVQGTMFQTTNDF